MTKPVTICVVIITKNEAHNIERCLDAVDWATERLVIDSGSTDDTISIAKAKGAKVIEREWPGFGPQKHFGISQLTTDWALVIDADEVVSLELRRSIEQTLRAPKNSCYMIHRQSYFLGKLIRHGDWGRDWIARLFDRSKHQWTQDLVHERLDVDKNMPSKLHGKPMHYTQESLHEALAKLNAYSSASAQIMFERNKTSTLTKAIIKQYWAFFRCFILRRGFLDGTRGYLIAKLVGENSYYKYTKLWEKKS